MKRWLFNTLAAMSLLIWLTCAVLWAYSFLHFQNQAKALFYPFDTTWKLSTGRLWVGINTELGPQLGGAQVDTTCYWWLCKIYRSDFTITNGSMPLLTRRVVTLRMDYRLGRLCIALMPIPLLWLMKIIKLKRARARNYRQRHHLCLTCGYDLTGNVSGTCPECGTAVAASEIAVSGRPTNRRIRPAWINLLLSVVVLVVALVVVPICLVRARHSAIHARCVVNLRQIWRAVWIYNIDFNRTPSSLDVLLQGPLRRNVSGQVKQFPGYVPSPRVFDCPACSGDPSKPPVATLWSGPTHYHVLLPDPPVEWSSIAQPHLRVLLYEPLSNHNDGGANFLFFDGHVERLEGAAAQDFIASLGTQTPTTKTESSRP